MPHDGNVAGGTISWHLPVMADSFTLYADPFWISPYVFSAHVALTEKQVAFQVRTVDLGTGEHRREPYLSSSLTSRVPALVHDGFWLSESSAIAEYLEDVLPPPSHPRLFPADPRQRARARQVMAFVRSDIGPLRDERSAETVFYRGESPPLSAAAHRAADKLIRVAEAMVGGGDDTSTAFGQWSIADADLAFALQRLIANGDPVPDRLRAYAEGQWTRPSIRAYLDHPRAPFVPYNY